MGPETETAKKHPSQEVIEINSLQPTDGGDNEQESKPPTMDDHTNVVDWDGPDDPEKPLNWPRHRKICIIGVVTASRFLTTLSSSMMAPAQSLIEADFDNASQMLIAFTVSIYVIGYAIGPMFLAPLSEVYGRTPIYHIGHVFFTIFTACCGLAPNATALLVFRLLAGLMGGVPVTNVGGTIADMVPTHRRGLIMSVFNATLILAPIVGPVFGGFLAQGIGWRWLFWLLTILSGLTTITGFLLLQETYTPVLLQKKTSQLRKTTGNTLLRAKGAKDIPLSQSLARAVRRPMLLLCTSPITLLLSLYVGVTYGITYLMFTSFSAVFQDTYGWSEGIAGLSFLGLGIGCCLGLLVTGRYSDRIHGRWARRHGEEKPESRLVFLPPAAAEPPIGLLIYGWTVQYKTHWIAPIIGTGIFGFGMTMSFSSINNYLVDVFTIYASSAMAANSLIRGLLGGFLPLSGPDMYKALGYGWGNSVLAFVAVVFGGCSVALCRWGEWLRVRYPVDL